MKSYNLIYSEIGAEYSNIIPTTNPLTSGSLIDLIL